MTISRRSLIAGLGAAGGAAALGAAAPAAAAAPVAPGNPVAPANPVQRHSPPVGLSPISSPRQPGVHYEFRCWDDFLPEDDLLYGRKFGGGGFYTNMASDFLAATFDLPPGAVLHDLEFYVSNTAAMSVYANVWQSSDAFLTTFWSATIAPGIGVTAHSFDIPNNVRGPYPHGTRLLVAALTTSDGSTLLNGVRAGFLNAPTSPVLLTTPQRAYDSRTSGGALATGQTRTVPLAAFVPAGALGVMVNLTVTGTVRSGSLTLALPGAPAPLTTSINWNGADQTLVNPATTAVGLNRSVTVTAAGAGSRTQFVVDVLGYLV